MKKKDQSISKNYLPLKLYLNDLESIEHVLRKSSQTLCFETTDYEYETIEDLRNNIKADRIRELHVKSNSPYVTIDFTSMWARIYVSSSETNSAGVFYQLDNIISKSTRRFKWLYSYYFLGILWIVTSLLNVASFKLARNYSLVLLLSLVLPLTIWPLWVITVRLRGYSTIVLTHKGSEKPFFQRNKDNLILAIISALLGGILGVAGTLIVNHFQNNAANTTEKNSR